MKNPYLIKMRLSLLVMLAVFTFATPATMLAQTPCTAPGQTVSPDAGTMTPKVSYNCSGLSNVVLEAAPDGNAVVPVGYQTLYVLTTGPNYVIRQTSATPVFSVSGNNTYRIHGLVYDPATLDVSTIVPHQTTAGDVNSQLVQGGGTVCASLDLVGAIFTVQRPVAGTVTAVSSKVCTENGVAVVAATPDGNANVPYPYTLAYVLTKGAGLVIEQLSSTPSFNVTTGGNYTVHTLVYDSTTLDLSTVTPGVTTGSDVNALLIQGGGSICASLDVAGAAVLVEDPFAGALTADPAVCTINISATPDGNAIVPPGYQTLYVLTSGAGLVIEQVNATPDFTLTANGLFTIHTLVYDPLTLDLSTVVPGVTTGFDVNSLLIQGGGSICGSLDVTGASFNIDAPYAGTITADASSACSGLQLVNLTATPDGNMLVATGYQVLYVLTSGPNYTIRQVGPAPSFNVSGNNTYRIHTLVYDPSTLDLSTVVLHQTSALSINAQLIQGGGSICASLDLVGAQFTVRRPIAGTITADNDVICFDGTSATVSATPDGNANIPYPFTRIFVLTSGTGLVIEQTSATASFTVTEAGLYTIHTLVYDPATLDLSNVVPGVTTGFDVNALLVQGGGSICASLDVAGAPTNVANPDAGGITSDDPVVCLFFGFANITATAQGNAVVPYGYQTVYLLTQGIPGTVIQTSANPNFIVNANGVYRINTLVYDPSTFSLGSIVIGSTDLLDLFLQFEQGGGSICASVDLIGGITAVLPFPLCNVINPRMTAEGDFDAQTYELLKSAAESGYATSVALVNTYPNPATSELKIDVLSAVSENITVSVYNMMGQEVLNSVINTQEGLSTHSVDVSALENGNYLIRIQTGTESVSKSFMVRN